MSEDGRRLARVVAELRDVSRIYEGAVQVHAVSDCGFLLREGDYVSVSGPSGSGKTTLLNLLGLIDVPTRGTVLLDGTDADRMTDSERAWRRAAKIGFVLQDSRLIWHRTALENVKIGLMYGRVSRRQRAELAKSALTAVGMGHRFDALPGTLSGGELQRVAVARALVRQPSLLLADEPTGSLDERNTEAVLGLLDQVNDAGQTIVVVTHDRRVASCARVQTWMADGALVRLGL